MKEICFHWNWHRSRYCVILKSWHRLSMKFDFAQSCPRRNQINTLRCLLSIKANNCYRCWSLRWWNVYLLKWFQLIMMYKHAGYCESSWTVSDKKWQKMWLFLPAETSKTCLLDHFCLTNCNRNQQQLNQSMEWAKYLHYLLSWLMEHRLEFTLYYIPFQYMNKRKYIIIEMSSSLTLTSLLLLDRLLQWRKERYKYRRQKCLFVLTQLDIRPHFL